MPYYATFCSEFIVPAPVVETSVQLDPPLPVVETSVHELPPVVVSSTALHVKTDNGFTITGISSPVRGITEERVILTLFTLVFKLCPAIIGTSFGDTALTDKLALTPDTATVEPVKGITVPTTDVRELPVIALTIFCVVVPIDKVDEVPVTAIVCPEAVTGAPIGEPYITVWYEKLVPLLIEAIKELELRVKDLEDK